MSARLPGWRAWKSLRIRKLKLSFVAIHYIYIILCIFVGAVLMILPGNTGMKFVDALFFASGAATQSGLNTIDVNKINTYQQIVIYFLPFITTPIFIHTMVVVVRIYWFEKRLNHIVEEARKNALHRVSSRSRTSLHRTRSRPGTRDAELGADCRYQSGTRRMVVGLRNRPSNSSTQSPRRGPASRPSTTNWTESRRPSKTPSIGGAQQKLTGAFYSPGDLSRQISGEHIKFAPTVISEGATPAVEHAETQSVNEGTAGESVFRGRRRSLSRRLSFETGRTRSRSRSPSPPAPYLSYIPQVGKNSQFLELTTEQRNELGGIEYRALKLLLVILILYYVVIHVLGVIVLVPWILKSGKYGPIVTDFGINKVWWAIYTSMTTFNDVGFTLTPDSFISFQQAAFTLLFCAVLIVAGNTGFPLFLRLFIWIAFKLCPDAYINTQDSLHFLLDHPRRCFTLLFPSRPTWWLFGILIFLNIADTILFLVLDLQTPVVESIPVGHRIVNALFQAVSTRTSGTASVPIGSLHPGIQVSYLVMMYISVLPLAISIRRTNVYEDLSLGVWRDPSESAPAAPSSDEGSYIKAHVRRQLEFDLWYVFLGLFLISVVEGRRIADASDYAFTTFSVFFEVVSAYGTVGLSLGYPGMNASLSGAFTAFSKVVIIAMEVRGRHRGLPYDLDRAVLLPESGSQAGSTGDVATPAPGLVRSLSREGRERELRRVKSK
ncbi:cation transport protein-domain-containing protein [Geopyxis carbonaria]|nr:cation transport protein-domain-containing protein [Geopyxis carbonaria]